MSRGGSVRAVDPARPPRALDERADYTATWTGRVWWAGVASAIALLFLLGALYALRGPRAVPEFLGSLLGYAVALIVAGFPVLATLVIKSVPHLGLIMRMLGAIDQRINEQAQVVPHHEDVHELAGQVAEVRAAMDQLVHAQSRMVRLMGAQAGVVPTPPEPPAQPAPAQPPPAQPQDDDPVPAGAAPAQAAGTDPLTAPVWPPAPQDWTSTSGSLRAVDVDLGAGGGAEEDRGEYRPDTGDLDAVDPRPPSDWWGPAGPPSRTTLDRLSAAPADQHPAGAAPW